METKTGKKNKPVEDIEKCMEDQHKYFGKCVSEKKLPFLSSAIYLDSKRPNTADNVKDEGENKTV